MTSINLYGYEVGAKGECKNEKDLQEFQKELGVIDYSHKKGCDVILTVYNIDRDEIAKFLNDYEAQVNFIERLESLIYRNSLKGVNIYFESLSKKDNLSFVNFMTNLHKELNRIDETVVLNLTIPSIYDD